MTMHTWEVEPIHLADCTEEEMISAVRIRQRFPMPDGERPAMLSLLRDLRHWMERRQNGRMQREIYLQMTQLPRPGGASVVSRNGSRWMPGLAMGVWPNREPPRSMNKEDFTHRLPGTKFPTLAYDARRILSREEGVKLDVEQQMAGSGALLEMTVEDGWAEKEGREVSAWLRSSISDEAYLNYPSYVPLLDTETLRHLSKDERSSCLAGIDLYLREDVKDESLFLIARAPLKETLRGIELSAGEPSHDRDVDEIR